MEQEGEDQIWRRLAADPKLPGLVLVSILKKSFSFYIITAEKK